jgi:hypothetical protein
MPISSGQVTVGTAAVQIDSTSASVYHLHIHYDGNQADVFIGGSDVTISNGLILPKQDSLEIQVPAGDAVWAVVGSGTHLISYLKVA